MKGWDFPGGPVVKNHTFTAGDVGSIPGRGTKILHDAWCSQEKKGKEWKKIFHANENDKKCGGSNTYIRENSL